MNGSHLTSSLQRPGAPGSSSRGETPIVTTQRRVSRSVAEAEPLVEGHGQDDDGAQHQALDLGAVDAADDQAGPLDDDLDQDQAQHRPADRADAAGEAAAA